MTLQSSQSGAEGTCVTNIVPASCLACVRSLGHFFDNKEGRLTLLRSSFYCAWDRRGGQHYFDHNTSSARLSVLWVQPLPRRNLAVSHKNTQLKTFKNLERVSGCSYRCDTCTCLVLSLQTVAAHLCWKEATSAETVGKQTDSNSMTHTTLCCRRKLDNSAM